MSKNLAIYVHQSSLLNWHTFGRQYSTLVRVTCMHICILKKRLQTFIKVGFLNYKGRVFFISRMLLDRSHKICTPLNVSSHITGDVQGWEAEIKLVSDEAKNGHQHTKYDDLGTPGVYGMPLAWGQGHASRQGCEPPAWLRGPDDPGSDGWGWSALVSSLRRLCLCR